MLKKLIITAITVSAGILLTCCSGRSLSADEFILKGKIRGGDLPDRVTLMYVAGDEMVLDTIDLKGNKFEFTGYTSEPSIALIFPVYNDKPASQWDEEWESADEWEDKIENYFFFLEPGNLKMTIDTRTGKSKVRGSVVNEDWEQWEEIKNRPGADVNSLGLDIIRRKPDSWFMRNTIMGELLNDPEQTPEFIQQVYDALPADYQQSEKGTQILEFIELKKISSILEQRVAIGTEAPDFTLPDPDGNPVSLSVTRGQWVLLDFWASWCGPCRAENPHVVKAYHELKDKGFTVFAVSLDSNKESGRRDWRQAIEEDGLPWTHVLDDKIVEVAGNTITVAQSYKVSGIPTNFLIDPAGRIVARDLRGKDLTEKILSYMN